MNGPGDVLIVDDDPDLLEVLELLLRGAGYSTRMAPNGLRALEAVAASMPGLILLDMLMPVMDGWQFAEAFHATYGEAAPIIVVSAAEHVRNRSKGVRAADLLPKPFERSELLRIVAAHIGPPPVPRRSG